MSTKKPIPLVTVTASRKCPVCGKSSYSQGGIHPQCAVTRADAPRRLRLAAEKRAKAKKPALRAWEKTCPKCQHQIPVRTGVCECGFHFSAKQR